MSFTLMACTDIRGQKVNVELPFEQPPSSMEALRSTLEHLFRREEEAIKYSMGYTDMRACEPFTINRLQRYDDDSQSWADVTSIDVLQTYDQLYLFRKNSTKADISTQRELPPPRMSEFFYDPAAPGPFHTPCGSSRVNENGAAAALAPTSGGYGGTASPSQARPSAGSSPYRVGGASGSATAAQPPESSPEADPYQASAPPPTCAAALPTPPPSSSFYYKERTTPERVEYLFSLGSQHNDSVALTEKAFEHIFRMASVAFPVEVLQDLFDHFATRGDGGVGTATMSQVGFQEFATYFPVLVNIAYQRITNRNREEAIRAAQLDNAKQVKHARRQLQELEARLEAARKEVQQAEQHEARLQEDLYDISMQRDPEYCQDEQKLLDKEVSVFKYRERLSREERDYERLAIERRKRAVAASARARSHSPQGAYDRNRYGPRG
ncbi:hypothetical protein CGC20_13440 [Leishmania donovani]|uniref:Uncharacterized protein n=3 Tax=Leishmania donovani species complex TaxID=38574 RepID=A4I3K4_LEIIN|nr:conserved hypothetical protein [Leishmania infantum JPCM5]TPP40503.1 hypothetical protein CGC20_13440 [Leishmania donovani]CAC9503157.1 hypothetical_protein_-_conserved [Leishmania infantum]CAM69358.1 conserved hypothetical protein [Leishmania infantum JPCM5]SUZ43296.1 hypothetical_protein_-_conserved [Leishmania infantum]|eukprot:XP_001470166.1 conserved hypothetical protein [Leishmania infantum JPCM5]